MLTPRRIRALVVADAVKARRFVSGALACDPEIDVVGTAANGSIALAKLARLQPDVVTLDPQMVDDGALETLRAIRQIYARLPVIVFSSFTESAWSAMPAAKALGASACIRAPVKADAADVGRCIREELIPKIKSLCARQSERTQRVEIVAIGISTGGPNALPVLLAGLPRDFSVPVVIVQHMPPNFTRLLAERLNTKCAIAVSEAVAGEPLRAGHVWLAPGGHHLVVASRAGGVSIETNQEPAENSCRPSADPLFRSVASVFGPSALAIVMTGMGSDGLAGCESIRAAGGQILVQDQATSVVWGMPGGVARAGLADAVLPLEELGPEIIRRVQAGRTRPHSSALLAHVR